VSNPDGKLDPWQGYWAATLTGAGGKSPRLLVPTVDDSVYEGGASCDNAQEIPVDEEVLLRPVFDTSYQGSPQKYGNYIFNMEKDGEVTIDIQTAKGGGSWMGVKTSCQGGWYADKWIAEGLSNHLTFKVEKGESYILFINKNGADTENIGLKVNFSASRHGSLVIDGRMLKYEDGTGFFWMGDTAWYLPTKLKKNEVVRYLDDRKAKGFNVIQMVSIRVWNNGGFSANAEGKWPFKGDYNSPLEPYWQHMDFILNEAEKRGIYIALLPTWNGSLKSEADAETYGDFIANRYKNRKNLIWVVGGDSNPDRDTSVSIWNSLGTAIQRVVSDNQLITYHPAGNRSSTDWFGNEDWIDFHMVQSAHCNSELEANKLFLRAYDSTRKPVLDGEPRYEDIEKCFSNPALRDGYRFTDHDVRKIAYRQVFSGALGHTYGHQSIWQMYRQGDAHLFSVTKTWDAALSDPGAVQMGYLATLMNRYPMADRHPDSTLIASGDALAIRGDGAAMIYAPRGEDISVNLSVLAMSEIKASWFDPRTGNESDIGTFANNGIQQFNPPGNPGEGSDWVLVFHGGQARDFKIIKRSCEGGYSDRIPLTGTGYELSNNTWGVAAYMDGQPWTECIFVWDDNGQQKGGWEWDFGAVNLSKVKSYPAALYKFSPALTVRDANRLNVSVDYEKRNIDGIYNIAMEFWLHPGQTYLGFAQNPSKYEVMFRFDQEGFNFGSDPSWKEVSIGGMMFDVYKEAVDMPDGESHRRWTFINFVATEKVSHPRVDVKQALDFLVDKGFTDILDLNVSDIQMGTEVISGKGMLLIHRMDVDASIAGS
jgi:hypothetical protein